MDVNNATRRLAGGMFPEAWPVRRSGANLFVPVSSVARRVDATFVARSVAKKSQDARGHEEQVTENHQRVSHDL